MAHISLIDVSKQYANGIEAVKSINMEIRSGELVCVLGASGCGKSTTLRMIAGLETVSSGQICIDGENVAGKPPRDRDIAMVFENYALYPHLNVFNNIAMPLKARGIETGEIRRRVEGIAATLGISQHLFVKPRHLSGGQRQRVSLARAMVRRPKMFLMDEPLGHLEAYLRVELRREIRRLHETAGGTTFYITHDQDEAAAIADRIAVMANGRIQQFGTLRDLLDRPVNRIVAEFVGEPPINMLEDVSIESGQVILPGGSAAMGAALMSRLGQLAGRSGKMALGIRPTDIVIAPDGFPAIVTSVQPMGEWASVLCDSPAGSIHVVTEMKASPARGAHVFLQFPDEQLHLFAADGTNLTAVSGASHG